MPEKLNVPLMCFLSISKRSLLNSRRQSRVSVSPGTDSSIAHPCGGLILGDQEGIRCWVGFGRAEVCVKGGN